MVAPRLRLLLQGLPGYAALAADNGPKACIVSADRRAAPALSERCATQGIEVTVAGHPQLKYGNRKWAFWQYTATGTVPGVGGKVDRRPTGLEAMKRSMVGISGFILGTVLGGVEIAEKVPTEETYGIAVAKDSTELLEEINGGLEEVISDGTYTKIYEKWFHLEPPKAIVG